MIKPLSLSIVCLTLGACVPSTAQPSLTAPADPSVGIATPRYTSVTRGIRPYDVVSPLDWRELNRRVAPGAADEGRGR
jgi:hypothetical protein